MVSLSTKVTEEFKDEVTRAASKAGKTTSDFLRICVEDAVNGHYRLDGEHLVPTEDYLVAITPTVDEPKYDYEALGVDRLLETLERKNYNLKDTIASMTQSAADAPAYSRKKGTDWGA